MLAYILAIAVAVGSFGLYIAAFFFPEVHRKNDFVWSGVGLFYALILWVCAGRITGAVLLGQTAGVALLGWLGWQMVTLRRAVTPEGLKTPVPDTLKKRVNQVLPSPSSSPSPPVEQPVQLEKSSEPEVVVPVTEPKTLELPQPVTSEIVTPPAQQPPTVVEQATVAAEEWVETATDKAEEMAEAAEEWVETKTDQAKEAVEAATDKAEEMAEAAEEWVETKTDQAKEAVEAVKTEAKTLSQSRPTAKSQFKRQNPISQLLGVVTGIFKPKGKPPTPTPTQVTQTGVTETTATLETESSATTVTEATVTEATVTDSPASEIVDDYSSEVDTIEIAAPKTPATSEREISTTSPFEELTATEPEPEINKNEAELIELADAVDQATETVVQTNSPARVNIGEIEETTQPETTTETVEIVEEQVTESEATVEAVEIVEEATVEMTEDTSPETEGETDTSSTPTPPSLKRPMPPNKKPKK